MISHTFTHIYTHTHTHTHTYIYIPREPNYFTKMLTFQRLHMKSYIHTYYIRYLYERGYNTTKSL